MPESLPEDRKWPVRLSEFCRELVSAQDEISLTSAREKVWRVLNASMSMYLRYHAAKLGGISREDVEDLAAQKSFELLQRIESGKTDFSDRSPSEIVKFVSQVARNELMDLLHERGRQVDLGEDGFEWVAPHNPHRNKINIVAPPDARVERGEFVEALRQCAQRLKPRSRLVWFFRVFYEMASKDIAVHPEVGLEVTHVDVILQRARRAIRDCMSSFGFEPSDMPPGTFFELWKVLRGEGMHEVEQ